MPKVNVPLVRPPQSAIRPPLASLPLLRNLQNKTTTQPPSIPSTTPPQAIAPPPPTPKALQAKAAPDTSSQKPESDPGVTQPAPKPKKEPPPRVWSMSDADLAALHASDLSLLSEDDRSLLLYEVSVRANGNPLTTERVWVSHWVWARRDDVVARFKLNFDFGLGIRYMTYLKTPEGHGRVEFPHYDNSGAAKRFTKPIKPHLTILEISNREDYERFQVSCLAAVDAFLAAVAAAAAGWRPAAT